MAQQKKDYIALHIKMDAPLMRRLEEYCDEAGQTKTMVREDAGKRRGYTKEMDEKMPGSGDGI